jgi:hypothetical protein
MTDSFNRHFAASLLRQGRISAFYDFENEARVFPNVHNQFRFAVLCMSGGAPQGAVRFAFYTRHVSTVTSRTYELRPEEIELTNPNTGTLPLFRTRRDARITLDVYKRHPILIPEGHVGENTWGLKPDLMFMMNTSSHLFQDEEGLRRRKHSPGMRTVMALMHAWQCVSGSACRCLHEGGEAVLIMGCPIWRTCPARS